MKQKQPKLRFPEFSDDWEEKNLSEISHVSTGFPFKSDEFEDNGTYLVITNSNIQNKNSYIDSSVGNKININHSAIQSYILNEDEIVITMDGTVGRSAKVKATNQVLAQRVGRLSAKEDSEFLYQLLNTGNFSASMNQLSCGGTIKHISLKDINNYKALFPNILEQQKIGIFFKDLDDNIELNCNKLTELKDLKSSLLQKMFPKKGAKVPEVRFPEFSGDWEETKLGHISERVRGNDGRMDLPTLTISASLGWLDQRDRFSANIAGEEQKNYTLLKKGELSYNHGNSKLAKYGVVFKLDSHEEALVPRIYHSFKVLDNICADFIEYMFATKNPDQELKKLISSGARMDGLLNISYSDFMGIKIIIPNQQEQQKIGAFFKNLDELIKAQQHKLTLLTEQKKALLQQMFV